MVQLTKSKEEEAAREISSNCLTSNYYYLFPKVKTFFDKMSFEQAMFDQMCRLPKKWSCSGYITIIRKNICQKTKFQSVDQTDQIYAGCKNIFDEMSFDQLTYDLNNIVEMVLWQLSKWQVAKMSDKD